MCRFRFLAIVALVVIVSVCSCAIGPRLHEAFWRGFWSSGVTQEDLNEFQYQFEELIDHLLRFNNLLWPWGHLFLLLFIVIMVWNAHSGAPAIARRRQRAIARQQHKAWQEAQAAAETRRQQHRK